MGRRSSRPWPPTTFPAWLKANRERVGLSLEQLAELAELDDSTLYRYESGRIVPPLPAALLLAYLLDADISDIRLEESPARPVPEKR